MTVNSKAVRRRSKVSRLAEGDSLEYSVSAAIRIPRQGEAWVKVGGTTHIHTGETDAEALGRLSDFVNEALDEAVSNLISN